jgi:hypothetical protein
VIGAVVLLALLLFAASAAQKRRAAEVEVDAAPYLRGRADHQHRNHQQPHIRISLLAFTTRS